jgi:hypothetical protein
VKDFSARPDYSLVAQAIIGTSQQHKSIMRAKRTIQRTTCIAGVATLAVLAHSNGLQAQTWQTVLDYQLAAGEGAGGDGLAADALGNVFAGGNAYDAAGTNHGIVVKTDTTQANWFLSDDTNPSATQYESVIWNLGIDVGGRVYSIGQLRPNSTGIASWYVNKSSDSGATWSTVDLYQYAPGKGGDATGFAADNSGNIYVAGWSRDAAQLSNVHWLVRKSADGGQTWNLVDNVTGPTANGAGFVPGAGIFVTGGRFVGGTGLQHSWLVRRSPNGEPGTWSTVDGPFANAAARGVAGDNSGNVYVSGSQFITTLPATKHTPAQGYYAWVTRKSSDGGITWSTVDTFTCTQNTGGYGPVAIGRNAGGNVVVVGNSSGHWIVRTPDLSGAWHTIDDFQLASGYAIASGVTTDAAGNLLVTGQANDSTGTHWVVRRLTSSP